MTTIGDIGPEDTGTEVIGPEHTAMWKMQHFADRGYVVIDRALDPNVSRHLLSEITTGSSQPWHVRDGVGSGGGRSNYQVLDGEYVAETYSGLVDWYRVNMPFIEGIVCAELEVSPHVRSAVNIKYYDAYTGCQGDHYDTNPITTILYLTDYGAPTVLVDPVGDRDEIYPVAGRMLLLDGRRVLHGVPSGAELPRVTVIMNYYYLGETERPDWIDQAVYENVDPSGA